MADQEIAQLHARAKVVGYPGRVLGAVYLLVDEIQADPQCALGMGLMMDAMREQFDLPGTGGRKSGLYGALADLVVVAAGTALEKGSDQ